MKLSPLAAQLLAQSVAAEARMQEMCAPLDAMVERGEATRFQDEYVLLTDEPQEARR